MTNETSPCLRGHNLTKTIQRKVKTMEIKIPVNKTNSYTTIQDYFLAHWVSTIGLGPAMLYLQLLSYCHKGKDIAWPSIQTLNKSEK